jgi:hypothetical protein
MALDTNIALGVRPIEQPNMLAQMGQMMQLRQAQQQYESENALRDLAVKHGGDISNPAFIRELGTLNPKMATDLRSKQLEQQQKGVETGIKINEALGGGLEWLSKNPSLDNAKNLFSDFVNKGILPADKAQVMFAKLQAEPDKIGYYANLGYQTAISAEKKLANATQIRGQDLSHSASMASVGATIRGQNLTDARTREGTWASVIVGDRVMEHNNRTGEWREASVPESTGGTVSVLPPTTISSGGAAPGVAPQVAPQAAPTNALAPQTAPVAPVVNALVQPPAATAPAPARQPLTTFNPKKVARETTNAAGDVTQYNERGEVVGVVPKAGKPSAAHEKELVTEAKKAEGQKTVQTLVASLADQYKGLLQEGGITSTAKGTMSNISARTGSSGAGQYVAGFIGTKAQELRDSIAQTRPLIINAIKDSTGMSAQQLNSNVELQNFLKAATDPSLSIEANLKALNNISKLYGLGTEFTMADMKGTTPASTGNIATDPTIDALLKKYK